ncbi:MAG: phenylalanine--tRNA ligase subunit beta [Cyanobacteria bacterium J06635_1]
MPTVTFPLDYLSRLTPMPPQQLEQQAFDYGLDATLRDNMLDVEVTAERPDLLAAEGFTRALNIYNGHPREVPTDLRTSNRVVKVSPTVLPLRPYIAALTVENVSLGAAGLDSLIQFQEKVTQTFGRQRKKIAIGIYDLDQIEGDIHYTTADKATLSFVPLDADTALSAQQILSEHPNGLLYGNTLPSDEQVPVLQDSTGKVLSLPPIINAAEVGAVKAETQNLFIDVTGISRKTVLEMINILAHNFLDAGSPVKTVDIQHPQGSYVTPSLVRQPVPFSAKRLNEVLGSAIAKTDLKKYLTRMDLQVSGTDVVWVPTYRTDIFSDTDIAGDLLVAIGVDNLSLQPTAIKFHMGTPDPLKGYVLKISDLAQRMELMEVKSFTLTNPDLLTQLGNHFVQADNAKTQTFSATRNTLQAGLLEILSHNISAPKPINIYETGEVVALTAEAQIIETFYWGFASLDARASFATAKAYVQTLLKALKISYQLTICDDSRYITGRAATVLVGDKPAGHFGEIHPKLLSHFSFPEPVCSGELDAQILMQASNR